MDELRQVSYYPLSFQQIVREAATQQQPPLDYWIGHVVHFFSDTDFSVRLPSALFGAGAVVLLAILVGGICSWPVGIGTGLIAALLPFNLFFSQEARPYAIAVFFSLLTLWALDRLLNCPEKGLKESGILFLVSVAFLHTRTLAPLVYILVLLLVLLVCFLLLGPGVEILRGVEKRHLILGMAAFSLSLALYVPAFQRAISHGDRYADTSFRILETLVTGFDRFKILPLWEAFVAQTDPLTYPLLVFTCFSPFFAWVAGLYSRSPLSTLSLILLPGASLLHLFVFQAKTTYAFRPPYAIYLLPLVLLLSALTFQGLWTWAGKTKFRPASRFLLPLVAALLILGTAESAYDFKRTAKKADWRGLAAYLTTSFSPQQLILFDSLSSYREWEPRPTFCGFPRYYRGRSELLYMVQVPAVVHSLARLSLEPILVLHYPVPIYLTPSSRYPIVPFPTEEIARRGSVSIKSDPLIRITPFHGFFVVRLTHPTNHLLADTYRLIECLLPNLPRDSSIVEIHLAAAAMARALGLKEWSTHLREAEALAQAENLQRVRDVGKKIEGIPPLEQAAEKSPSAALPSSLVIAAYRSRKGAWHTAHGSPKSLYACLP